jgi:hypothetical protein
MEKLIVSRLKFAVRRASPPISPAACCIPRWNPIIPTPTRPADSASTTGWGRAAQAIACPRPPAAIVICSPLKFCITSRKPAFSSPTSRSSGTKASSK